MMDLALFLGAQKVLSPRPSVDFVAGVVVPGRYVDTVDAANRKQASMPLFDIHQIVTAKKQGVIRPEKPFFIDIHRKSDEWCFCLHCFGD